MKTISFNIHGYAVELYKSKVVEDTAILTVDGIALQLTKADAKQLGDALAVFINDGLTPKEVMLAKHQEAVTAAYNCP